MGQDIYLVVEAREDGCWERVSPPPAWLERHSGARVGDWMLDRDKELFFYLKTYRGDPADTGDTVGFDERSWMTLTEIEGELNHELECYAKLYSDWESHFVPILRRLAEERGISGDDVRVLYGFD